LQQIKSMDKELVSANKKHVESRKIQNKILKWDDKECPLAKLGSTQIDVINQIEEKLNTKATSNVNRRI
jgi:hypothetical protein